MGVQRGNRHQLFCLAMSALNHPNGIQKQALRATKEVKDTTYFVCGCVSTIGCCPTAGWEAQTGGGDATDPTPEI